MALKKVIAIVNRAFSQSSVTITPNTRSKLMPKMNCAYGSHVKVQTALLHRTPVRMESVSYEDLLALLDGGNIQLIDVREPCEIEKTGKIAGAINIPVGQVKQALLLDDDIFLERFHCEKPQKKNPNVIFYGLGPIKCRAAFELARKAGYKNCREYSGGLEDWLNHMGKVEKVPG